MTQESTYVAMTVAIVGKVLIVAADTMPPPPADCPYWQRWAYDCVQRLASNSAKVGDARPPKA